MSNTVFLLHHVHIMPSEEEDVKLIGVYQTKADAVHALMRARQLPGFSDAPEGFDINEYEVGKDHWLEGYFTWKPGQDE